MWFLIYLRVIPSIESTSRAKNLGRTGHHLQSKVRSSEKLDSLGMITYNNRLAYRTNRTHAWLPQCRHSRATTVNPISKSGMTMNWSRCPSARRAVVYQLALVDLETSIFLFENRSQRTLWTSPSQSWRKIVVALSSHNTGCPRKPPPRIQCGSHAQWKNKSKAEVLQESASSDADLRSRTQLFHYLPRLELDRLKADGLDLSQQRSLKRSDFNFFDSSKTPG